MSRILITIILSIIFINFGESKEHVPNLGIIGGVEVNIEDHRHQVGFLAMGSLRCGGIIYKRNVVLTAAHCLFSNLTTNTMFIPDDLIILAGTSDHFNFEEGKLIGVKSFKIHPDYKFPYNDLAILYLKKKLKYGPKIQQIEITDNEPAVGSQATASGWGVHYEDSNIAPPILNAVNVSIIDREKCAKMYINRNVNITENIICAGIELGGKDSCKGDSGGPLVQDKKLVGIIGSGHKCALAEYPGVYTNIVKFKKWITDQINH